MPLVRDAEPGYYIPPMPFPTLDPRLAIIAPMAATIFVEKQIYHNHNDARKLAVDQAFLLFGEIQIRLAGNDR